MKANRTKAHLLDLLASLAFAAARVDSLHGHSEDGSPCDWSEWVDLRRTVMEARYALKREGVDISHHPKYEMRPKGQGGLVREDA